ncbi:MAG: hypothetical protein HKN04_05790 [Rhodothermaceae bacterium]|nr:hypothetical protein [Rhodothermaceae bacterium]
MNRDHHSDTGRGRLGASILCAVCLTIGLAPYARAQGETLQDAISAYEIAEFDQAIDLLASLVEDPQTSHEQRKEALQYLGRAAIAAHRSDQARDALLQLLELEPPLYEPDPHIGPPDYTRLYYDLRHERGGSYAVERADPGMKTLAIMDFTNSSVDRHDDFDPLRQGFASMMIHYLSGATGLKVIERERIQWLLDELAMQRDEGLVDPESAVRAGRLLGATGVLFGAFTAHGDQLWISTRLVKVETGEVLLAEQVIGEPDDFFALVERLSTQVAEAIDVSLGAEDLGERRETDSLDAMMAYSEGLVLMEQGDPVGAQAHFQEALAHDPDYELAERRLQGLRPLVAAAQAP